MFHPQVKGPCPVFNEKERKFYTKGFLELDRVIVVLPSGRQVVSNYHLDKLKRFAFPKMGITEEKDKKKVLDDLKKAADALPIVPEAKRPAPWKGKDGGGKTEVAKLREEVAVLHAQQKSSSKGSSKSSKNQKKEKEKSKGKAKTTKVSTDKELEPHPSVTLEEDFSDEESEEFSESE